MRGRATESTPSNPTQSTTTPSNLTQSTTTPSNPTQSTSTPSNPTQSTTTPSNPTQSTTLPFNDFHITKIDQFVNYFNETYLLSSIFPIKLWKHYATTGPRTNNHVEGYNNKLKCFVGAAKPNIFKIVSIFKNEETNSDKKFRKATADPPSKPPPRDTYYADKDVKLKIFKDLFADGGITLDTYWMNISALYEFKKKEKLNDNESSSSSDSEELTSDEEEIEDGFTDLVKVEVSKVEWFPAKPTSILL